MKNGKNGHVLWCDGDEDIPDQIKDRNGQVILDLCKNCGRGEVELEEPCSVEMKAKVYWRDSTKEWVLEIDGVIGDTSITSRHTQPRSVKMQDVPGLDFTYRKIERLEALKRRETKRQKVAVIHDPNQVDLEEAIESRKQANG